MGPYLPTDSPELVQLTLPGAPEVPSVQAESRTEMHFQFLARAPRTVLITWVVHEKLVF